MSEIVGPNGQPAQINFDTDRAPIGGVECEYQTDPRVGVNRLVPEAIGLVATMICNPPRPVYVVVQPEALCTFVASQINMNSALIRELLTLRKQIEAVNTTIEERLASAPTERLDADDIVVE